MPASSLLVLIDDIASTLDDVAALTKVAAKKTAGVLGDDLALNAQQVAGVEVDRELPVVWAVAKGSAVNKLILVPAALAISAALPWLITPLLMLGGAYLCFEGFEKLVHPLLHPEEPEAPASCPAPAASDAQIAELERGKIKGAIRTDFILSAEIVVIALGSVEGRSFAARALTLTSVAVLMTVGVYGLVAAIVKLDDLGLILGRRPGALRQWASRTLLAAAPILMRFLGVAGTVAMFLVGGGILLHGIPGAEALVGRAASWAGAAPAMGRALEALAGPVISGLFGVLAGAAVLAGVTAARRLRPAR